MSNFSINFSYPWLLLLLLPAVFFTLFSYFRSSKRYRRNRNRIVSLVCHGLVMLLSILVLSGISFNYDVPNTQNELILLVDASYSNREEEDRKNEFVQDVIAENGEDCKVGVVKFGYDQLYAVPLTHNTTNAYRQYLESDSPDTSATDIASALHYARGLFSNPESAKIVLITDGIETDGDAATAIKSIAADGVKVDTVYFPNPEIGNEVEIVGITTPDYNVTKDTPFTMVLTMQSSYRGTGVLKMFDNDEEILAGNLMFREELTELEVGCTFTNSGMHVLRFEIAPDNAEDDKTNNAYCTYINVKEFNKVLILERNDGESEALRELIMEEYDVSVANITDPEVAPKSVEELRSYDQVILVNVAYADMPDGFEQMLYSYVHDFGGGMLTVGGNKYDESGNVVTDPYLGDIVSNAYNKEDLAKSKYYKEMLPVQAIDYSPPLGVMFIIDRSGSMFNGTMGTAGTKFEVAQTSVRSALRKLNARDWAGIMTLEDTYSEEIEMMPLTEIERIDAVVQNIPTEEPGGTIYTGAIQRAGAALSALTTVKKRHIIIITDGEPGDSFELYGAAIDHCYKKLNITVSIATIDATTTSAKTMKQAVELGGGRYYNSSGEQFGEDIKEELTLPAIKSYNPEPFKPYAKDRSPVTQGIVMDDVPELGGFYGTKERTGATVALMGEFVPIYAHWNFGKGTVGSFMCDLRGSWANEKSWSTEFMASEAGESLIRNMINANFPVEDIRYNEIQVVLDEQNYTNNMSVFTELGEGERIEVTVTSPSADGAENTVQTLKPTATEGFTRLTFSVTQPGLHTIVVQKKDAEGNVLAEYTTYKTFSYSKEYDVFVDVEACALFVQELAKNGRGSVVDRNQAWTVYDDFDPYLHRTYDPRLPFLIVAIVLFLIDVAVRKFKFKWLHEIFRDRKAKKAMKS